MSLNEKPSLFQVVQKQLQLTQPKQLSPTKPSINVQIDRQSNKQSSPTTRFQSSLSQSELNENLIEDYSDEIIEDETPKPVADDSSKTFKNRLSGQFRKAPSLTQITDIHVGQSNVSSSSSNVPQIPPFSPKNVDNQSEKFPKNADYDEEGFLEEEAKPRDYVDENNDNQTSPQSQQTAEKVSNFFQKKLQLRSFSEQNILRSFPMDQMNQVLAGKGLKKGFSTLEQTNQPKRNPPQILPPGNGNEETSNVEEKLRQEKKDYKNLLKSFLKRFMKFKRKKKVAELMNFVKAAGKDKELMIKTILERECEYKTPFVLTNLKGSILFLNLCSFLSAFPEIFVEKPDKPTTPGNNFSIFFDLVKKNRENRRKYMEANVIPLIDEWISILMVLESNKEKPNLPKRSSLKSNMQGLSIDVPNTKESNVLVKLESHLYKMWKEDNFSMLNSLKILNFDAFVDCLFLQPWEFQKQMKRVSKTLLKPMIPKTNSTSKKALFVNEKESFEDIIHQFFLFTQRLTKKKDEIPYEYKFSGFVAPSMKLSTSKVNPAFLPPNNNDNSTSNPTPVDSTTAAAFAALGYGITPKEDQIGNYSSNSDVGNGTKVNFLKNIGNNGEGVRLEKLSCVLPSRLPPILPQNALPSSNSNENQDQKSTTPRSRETKGVPPNIIVHTHVFCNIESPNISEPIPIFISFFERQ